MSRATPPQPTIDSGGAATERVYSGIWAFAIKWFKVPRHPPSLPTSENETLEKLKPARGYLNYLRLGFFSGVGTLVLILVGGASFAGIAAYLESGSIVVAAILLPIALLISGWSLLAGFVSLHLRYDTMWYVMNDRSIRIRRGFWTIRESTLTFENVQNVSIRQGPLQRFFGIANLLVETAGGGSTPAEQGGKMGPHQGLVEGIADPHRIRQMIMERLRRSKSAGLGDDAEAMNAEEAGGLNAAQISLLKQIRDLAKTAAS